MTMPILLRRSLSWAGSGVWNVAAKGPMEEILKFVDRDGKVIELPALTTLEELTRRGIRVDSGPTQVLLPPNVYVHTETPGSTTE